MIYRGNRMAAQPKKMFDLIELSQKKQDIYSIQSIGNISPMGDILLGGCSPV